MVKKIALICVWVLCAQPALAGPVTQGFLSRIHQLQQGSILHASCCKICRKGKACGDSCIARDRSCHKSAGCACNS